MDLRHRVGGRGKKRRGNVKRNEGQGARSPTVPQKNELRTSKGKKRGGGDLTSVRKRGGVVTLGQKGLIHCTTAPKQ